MSGPWLFPFVPAGASPSKQVAVYTGGAADPQSIDLVLPDDFPGHPALDPGLMFEIELVTVALQTDANVANRRVRLELFTDTFVHQIDWAASTTVPANTLRRHIFNRYTLPTVPGLVANFNDQEGLPSGMVMFGQSWTLRVSLLNAQAGDYLDKIVVVGQFFT